MYKWNGQENKKKKENWTEKMEGIFDAKLYTINFPIANADNITQRRGKETSPPPLH